MRLALFGKSGQEILSQEEKSLFECLSSYKDDLLIEASYLDLIRQSIGQDYKPAGVIYDKNFDADFALSIGGDGTFLRTADQVADKRIPILGINCGRLGFLAYIPSSQASAAIKTIHNGTYQIARRNLLELEMDSAGSLQHTNENIPHYALNDISILKHDMSSMISIDTKVNGQHLVTYMADGLVVSTPTGSTAYSLSIGGAIIDPATNVIELTPVAPHNLSMRPIVLQDSSIITINVSSRSHSFLISVDGHSFSASENQSITIHRAPYQILTVQPDGSDFFTALREKMSWGVDQRL